MAEARTRRPLQAILLVALVAVAATALFVLLVPLGSTEPDVDTATVGGHPLLNEPAPELDLESIDGEAMTLAALRGRPVLINFWATWCLAMPRGVPTARGCLR